MKFYSGDKLLKISIINWPIANLVPLFKNRVESRTMLDKYQADRETIAEMINEWNNQQMKSGSPKNYRDGVEMLDGDVKGRSSQSNHVNAGLLEQMKHWAQR